MRAPDTEAQASTPRYNVLDAAEHALHECPSAAELAARFEAQTGCPIYDIASQTVLAAAPRAIFAVGSIPLGMGTRGSDVDLLVLVDSKRALISSAGRTANSNQKATFINESDLLLAAESLTLHNGILVDLQVVVTPAIRAIQERLRRRGPELSESEIRTLGRLSTGWLLFQTEGYLERASVNLKDPALAVYACTHNLVTALGYDRKAKRALELGDLPLALHLGRSAIEMAYLAYFASEGMPYLGAKWLAQIGFAREATQRLVRHPLLEQGIHLLFPGLTRSSTEAVQYLERVAAFLTGMRALMEQRPLFRIAFSACAQISAAARG